MTERLKIDIEILHTGDGRVFINKWDSRHGDDTVVEVIDGKLMLMDTRNEVTVNEWIKIVTDKILTP
jgi:hypothetical protein